MRGEDWIDVSSNGVTFGARQHKNETRLPVLLWGDIVVSSFVAINDGYAAWGRPQFITYPLFSLPIADGIEYYKNIMHKLEHWGPVPDFEKVVPDWNKGSAVIPTSPPIVIVDPSAIAASPLAPVFTMLSKLAKPFSVSALTEQAISDLAASLGKAGGDALAASSKKHVDIIKSWLIDTGCGHDLISRKDLQSLAVKITASLNPLTFNTANGQTVSTEAAHLYNKELKEELLPHVLSSTPPVLSVGRRCMEMGYSFVWLNGQAPNFICPDGMIVELIVRDNIPYLRPGKSECIPQIPSSAHQVPCAAGEETPVLKKLNLASLWPW